MQLPVPFATNNVRPPELSASVYGPTMGKQPPPASKRHPILDGFDETDILPFGGRLDAAQTAGLAHLAERHGNGLIDVTSRANLQIRGVTDTSHRLVLGNAVMGLFARLGHTRIVLRPHDGTGGR